MPFDCPICRLAFEDFHLLVSHVFQLARWYLVRPNGRGVGARKRHYDWLKNRGIPIECEAIKSYLEDLLRLGLNKEV